MPADRVGHDLAQRRLTRPRPDVPAARKHCETEQHRAEDQAQQQFSPLGTNHFRLFEQWHAVRYRLDACQRAATGGEGLQHQEHAHRLETVRGEQRPPGLGGMKGKWMDQADRNDREKTDDEDHRGKKERPGCLAETAQV